LTVGILTYLIRGHGRLFILEKFSTLDTIIRALSFKKLTIFSVYIAKDHAKMVLFKDFFAIFTLSFDFTSFMVRRKLVSLPISQILR